jgi:hypothetical protein
MSDLLDLLDDWTDAPEWVILGDWGLCGLCGTKCSFNQGGSRTGAVCDACALIDSCRLVCCEPVAERRKAHIGVDQFECAHCDCGWWQFETYWHDEGEYRLYTPEEVTDMLAEHAIPRHVSHWGMSHPPEKHDDLVKAQAKRRAAYWARVANQPNRSE